MSEEELEERGIWLSRGRGLRAGQEGELPLVDNG